MFAAGEGRNCPRRHLPSSSARGPLLNSDAGAGMAFSKIGLIAALGLVMSAPLAVAADLDGGTYNWTGAYVGGQLGYGWGYDKIHDNFVANGFSDYADEFNLDGFLGGVHAGYDLQINRIVIGVVGDADLSGVDGKNVGWPFGDRTTSANKMQASLRARAGVAFDRALFYVTGGLAAADIHADFYDGANHDSRSDWRSGYTLGAGAEFALRNNWSANVEYRFSSFKGLTTVTTTTDPGWMETDKLRPHSLMIGLSYRF